MSDELEPGDLRWAYKKFFDRAADPGVRRGVKPAGQSHPSVTLDAVAGGGTVWFGGTFGGTHPAGPHIALDTRALPKTTFFVCDRDDIQLIDLREVEPRRGKVDGLLFRALVALARHLRQGQQVPEAEKPGPCRYCPAPKRQPPDRPVGDSGASPAARR